MQLTVTNIGSLFAIRSAPFILRNEPWRLAVFKDHLNELGIRLSCMTKSETFSCGIELSAKLVSMKSGVEPIKEARNDSMKRFSSTAPTTVSSTSIQSSSRLKSSPKRLKSII